MIEYLARWVESCGLSRYEFQYNMKTISLSFMQYLKTALLYSGEFVYSPPFTFETISFEARDLVMANTYLRHGQKI